MSTAHYCLEYLLHSNLQGIGFMDKLKNSEFWIADFIRGHYMETTWELLVTYKQNLFDFQRDSEEW
jgi:hypothetical protein